MKIFSDYTSITLNNTFLKGEEIISYCEKQKTSLFDQVAEFMKDWLLPHATIELATSGSTGKPKSILVGKNQMLLSASRTAEYFHFKQGQNALLCLPANYIAGKMMIVRALFSGLHLVVVTPSQNPLESLKPGSIIHFAAMIPLQLNQSIHHPSLSQIKAILLGGGPLDENLEKLTQKVNTEIFHGYGMTETLSHIALRRVNGKNSSQSYQALKGIELGKDNRNCLTITAKGFLEETLITNDLVSFTGTNEFTWQGRYDNIINSGGIKLIPEEIEAGLQLLLDRRFYVAGVDDEKLGKKLILVIEGEAFNKIELASLKDKMEDFINQYAIPKEIFFVKNFANTVSGKINRLKTSSLIVFQKK